MDETRHCLECGEPMGRAERPLVISYKGLTHTIAMPGWYCTGSHDGVHTREDMRTSDRALVALKAEVENLATPDEVRRIRLDLGLSQADAGLVIGGGVRAFQKYESGEILTSRAMTNLLRLLERHPGEIEHLRLHARQGEGERELA